MRDQRGYFGQFKQSLYYARLHADRLAELAAEAGQPGSPDFGQQQQRCAGEAALYSLFRALCFLSCVVLPESNANQLLHNPNSLLQQLEIIPEQQRSAAFITLQQQLATDRASSDVGLYDLVLAWLAVWQAPSGPKEFASSANLIPTRQAEHSEQEFRRWIDLLGSLADQLVDLQTES